MQWIRLFLGGLVLDDLAEGSDENNGGYYPNIVVRPSAGPLGTSVLFAREELRPDTLPGWHWRRQALNSPEGDYRYFHSLILVRSTISSFLGTFAHEPCPFMRMVNLPAPIVSLNG